MFSGIAEIYDTLMVQIHLYFEIIKPFLSEKALIQDMGNRVGTREARMSRPLAVDIVALCCRFGYVACI